MPEVIEHALDAEALSRRWREILDDPRLADFAGKIGLDSWGRIITSPVSAEAWIVFPRSRRIEFYGKAGAIDRT